jgi:hypothetical protein
LVFVALCADSEAADTTAVYKSVLPDDVFAQLVADDAKVITDSLKNATDKKMAAKAKTSALMIAVYAQGAMTKPGAKQAALAGLRDTALKVIKAADGNPAQALKLAADLKPEGKADPAAKTTPVAVHEAVEIDIVMQQFKPERGGGLDVEKKLLALVNKRTPYTPAEYKDMVPLLYRIAAIAQPTEAMAPPPMGKKTPAQWVKLSKEMADLALHSVEVAKKPKPDNKEVKDSLKKLEANCTNCHTVFRDE